MARPHRTTAPGMAYHVLNRRVMRLPLFDRPADYDAFERILIEAIHRPDAPRLLAFCLMPNHWHLLLWPLDGCNLSTWMQWVTVTHTHRWHMQHRSVGEGPIYQGRFRSFPIQEDRHLLMVLRYIEANPLRAELVDRADAWPWGSLWIRLHGSPVHRAMLTPPPIDLPADWTARVNEPQDAGDVKRVRHCLDRSAPLGDEHWIRQVVRRLGLESTQRPRGRPRKREGRGTGER